MRDPYVASVDDYVAALGDGVRLALPATAIRNRSLDARQLLARAALQDAGTLDDLLTAARRNDRRWLGRIRKKVDVGVLAALAQTLALQDLLPDDRRDALGIYELIRTALGAHVLTPANQGLHAQLALAWDGPARARQLLDVYRAMKGITRTALEIDLLNPFIKGKPAGDWPAAFRALMPEPGPELSGTSPAPFDRLTAAPPPRVDAPQRVSVVVTAYRPGEGLITAVRSILAQSWSNTEILIVDDASPPEFEDVLKQAAALGDRIRLVRMPANSGTYAARNAGLDAAGGEFVAFQDSDDWSHPRRLERQVTPLLDDRELVATTSDGISVTDDLRLTRIGVRSGRLNPSSLLFRRSMVTGRVGYFDRVRKGADSEFIGRIQAAFGAGAVRHVDEPLALIRLSANSLSRAEITAHWMHPARVAYSSAYLRWHHLIERGEAEPFRPIDGGRRPYAAPAHLRKNGTTTNRTRAYDVVVVADWRFLDGTQLAALDEIETLSDAGLRVALVQLESYRAVYLKRAPLCAPVQQLINAGRVDQLLIGERAEARLLIVRQAEVLQFGTAEESGVRARRVIVVADRAPVRSDGSDRRYTPRECTRAVLRLFGADPVWCPQDAGVRAALRTVDPGLPLTSADLPAAVDGEGWVAPRRAAGERPVVGTDLCDAAGWPADLPEAIAVHRRLDGMDVRVRLPDRPMCMAELPRDWLVYQSADLPARPFLHQLDFYLHFPHDRTPEVLSRPALAAAVNGCVVVLPERFAAMYGDAAVYSEPAGAAETIRRYADNPALYAEQSRRARAVVARAYHPDNFLRKITELVRPAVTVAPITALPDAVTRSGGNA